MGKVIKILLSFLSATLLALIILPIACSLLLNLPSVQDYAGRKLTGWLSGKLQTEVHVDKLRLRLFNRVTLDGLYIEDYHQDTMLYARRIVVPLQSLNPFTGRVALGRVELEQPKFYLMQDSTGRTNLKQILLKLKRERRHFYRFRACAENGHDFKLTHFCCRPPRTHPPVFRAAVDGYCCCF